MSRTAAAPLVATLRHLLRPPAVPRREERCSLCGADLPGEHAHLVDLHERRLLCACRLCGGLDTAAGGGAGRYRMVSTRYVELRPMCISPSQWEALAIPVGLAFFFFNSELGRVVAFYPGPAGATQSLLPLEAWSAFADAHPVLRSLEPDVEALLVRRTGQADAGFLVPIDACYELAGRIRATWTGLSGGDALEAEIDRFFTTIRDRSRP